MYPSTQGLVKAAAFLTISTLLAFFAVAPFTDASSHREAPMISQDPSADNTDVYAFVSPDRPDSVTLIGLWWPFEEPGGGPNFYRFDDNAQYLMHVDNNGDAEDEVTFLFQFRTDVRNPDTFLYNTGQVTSLDDPDLNIRQFYTVTRIADLGRPTETRQVLGTDIPVAPSNVGSHSMPNYQILMHQAVRPVGDGYNVFAGQADDPFFADVAALFDLLTIRPGPPGNVGGGKDTLHGFNVQSIVLQIPTVFLTKNGQLNTDPADPNAIIGVWMSTNRSAPLTIAPAKGMAAPTQMVQVSRLGNPLVNEVVIPLGLKDAFNGLNPSQDAATLSMPDGSIPVVQQPILAGLLHAIYGIAVPPTPRNDLVTVFLTGVPGLNQPANVKPAEMLRLNTAIMPTPNASRLGVLAGDNQGFPNGRRLADDVVDIELRVVAGVLVDGFNIAPNNQLGDGVDANDLPFSSIFPYLATPWPGFEQSTKK